MHEVFTKLAITEAEYALRRKRLSERMPPSSIAILPAAREKLRNKDTHYPFRQESSFYYLTGFKEPDALFVMLKGQTEEAEFILFCHPSESAAEVWTGKRAGLEGALKQFGAGRSFSLEELDAVIPNLLGNLQHIFYSLGQNTDWDARIVQWVTELREKEKTGPKAPSIWMDLLSLVFEERLMKSPAEIGLLKEASEISAEAHIRVMKTCGPDKMEYELEAEFLHHCYKKGCRATAYPSIVGGGENACTLHYIDNNSPLRSGDLVLVDAGGEYQYYASDITRTFPVNGKFSDDQKSIYELVLKAQIAAIGQIQPGISYHTIQETILNIMVHGLVQLGILKGELDELISQKAYQPFYMHSSGHWLGLDVHDVGEYKINGEWRKLSAGMVLTVEPGLYIPKNLPQVDKRWWGIGIRIEDDILVTDTGHEVLSGKVPKTVEAIERLMGS